MLQMSGLSLIEIQVSFLLVSISVVGIARLQLASQQEIEHAESLGYAYGLLEETSRRISLNSKSSGDYRISELNNYPPYQCLPCSPSQMIKLDHSDISELLLRHFDQGSAKIFSCNGGICMTIAWQGADINKCNESETCIERLIW